VVLAVHDLRQAQVRVVQAVAVMLVSQAAQTQVVAAVANQQALVQTAAQAS
jgi:hypothetical protein